MAWLIFIVLINPAIRPVAPDLSYSAFKRHVAQGDVAAITIQRDRLMGEFHQALPPEGESEGKTYRRFRTVVPPFAAAELGALLKNQDITVRAKEVDTP